MGGTPTLTGDVQPTFLWQRTGIQVAPLASYNKSRTELITGILTNNLTTSPFGGRVPWAMPGNLKFSTLSFEGDFNRIKSVVTDMDSRDKTLALVGTIVWGHRRKL